MGAVPESRCIAQQYAVRAVIKFAPAAILLKSLIRTSCTRKRTHPHTVAHIAASHFEFTNYLAAHLINSLWVIINLRWLRFFSAALRTANPTNKSVNHLVAGIGNKLIRALRQRHRIHNNISVTLAKIINCVLCGANDVIRSVVAGAWAEGEHDDGDES